MGGCIYIGTGVNDITKNGILKVGMTEEDKPYHRLCANDLTGRFYFRCPKATRAELLFLESCARLTAQRIGLSHYRTDFFYYTICGDENKQASELAWKIVESVADYADQEEIEFQLFRGYFN